jgi:hypothetical protein
MPKETPLTKKTKSLDVSIPGVDCLEEEIGCNAVAAQAEGCRTISAGTVKRKPPQPAALGLDA